MSEPQPDPGLETSNAPATADDTYRPRQEPAPPKPAEESMRRVSYEGKELILVGTAHVSPKSVQDVQSVIYHERPDSVCVELDEIRYRSLTDDEYWRKLDIFQVVRQKKVGLLLANTALSSIQRRIGKKLGVQPGAEMLAAVQQAEKMGAGLVLADRNIQATFRRTWRNLSWWNQARMLSVLLVAPFSSIEDEIGEDDIEKLKEQGQMTDMLTEFAKVMPQVKKPLIDERNQYLISKVREAPGEKVVAVVGAAHVPGMLEELANPVDREALEQVPPPSPFGQALKWVIPAIVLSAFAWGYFKLGQQTFEQMVYAWLLPNAVLALLGTVIAGGKPLTILTAAVASPITSLNPALPVGVATGLVEAWLRRPTVDDCEHITDDISSLRGIYRNRFTRVLLVVVLSIFGSAAGAWVGGVWVVRLLFGAE
jgi:pheromone shutdown-related protein TraB